MVRKVNARLQKVNLNIWCATEHDKVIRKFFAEAIRPVCLISMCLIVCMRQMMDVISVPTRENVAILRLNRQKFSGQKLSWQLKWNKLAHLSVPILSW